MVLDNGHAFEQEVLRIARILWNNPYGGSVMEDGRERDGVFINDDVVHLIECTTLRTKEKAEYDGKKLADQMSKARAKYADKVVKGWFITQQEPTADQHTSIKSIDDGIRSGKLVATSFDRFKAQLIDAIDYIRCRKDHYFGSMQNLKTGKKISSSFANYVPLNISDDKGNLFDLGKIADGLIDGKNFVLTGDYGAGKSTTTRQLFIELAKRYQKKESIKFPIHINLRDHQGQSDTAEALLRHSIKIGFSKPDQLVRAWNSGEVILVLDGFDEISSVPWTQNARTLKAIRRNSVKLVREFVRDTRDPASILVVGRQFFFDTPEELISALDLRDRSTTLKLDDFTDAQVEQYLKSVNLGSINIPAWLPSRPLLLGYLATTDDLLKKVLSVDSGLSPAAAWDMLLTKISEREAGNQEDVIDGEAVRTLIERLASNARRSTDGLGSFQISDLDQVFTDICGYNPDNAGRNLLQRLPGLAPKKEDGSRGFIDNTLVDAARSGDVIRYVNELSASEIGSHIEWQATLGELGRSLAASRLLDKDNAVRIDASRASMAAQTAVQINSHVLAADIIQVMKDGALSYRGKDITIKNVVFDDATFGDKDLDYSRIHFQDCLFHKFELLIDADQKFLPRFSECYFGVFIGRLKSDLPDVFAQNCEFGSFDDSSDTNAAVLNNQALSLSVRVLLSVLKKVYVQSGGGRKESALSGGLVAQSRSLLSDVLAVLKSENFIIHSTSRGESIWLPVRSKTARARRILTAPTESQDPLIQKISEIG
jgi:NACHT domain